MTSLCEAQLRARARDLLATGEVDLFVGYRQGSNALRTAPFVARTPAEAERLIWNPVCVANLGGTLQKHAARHVGVALKACDARTVIELLRLNQLDRGRLHIVGVPCTGMVDPERVAALVPGPITGLAEDGADLLISAGDEKTRHVRAALLLTKCATCAEAAPALYDELLVVPEEAQPARGTPDERFTALRALEELDPSARLAFWSEHLSRCTLCYACQTACPLCYCKECPLTLERGDPRRQAREPATVFGFHMLRAFHLADRCTGCDECERVCPEAIPLSLICRKLELDRGNQ
jgi:ferredoxin